MTQDFSHTIQRLENRRVPKTQAGMFMAPLQVGAQSQSPPPLQPREDGQTSHGTSTCWNQASQSNRSTATSTSAMCYLSLFIFCLWVALTSWDIADHRDCPPGLLTARDGKSLARERAFRRQTNHPRAPGPHHLLYLLCSQGRVSLRDHPGRVPDNPKEITPPGQS